MRLPLIFLAGILVLLATSDTALCQSHEPFVAGHVLTPPADWPQPDEIRTAAGRPGLGYWQQETDYVIHAELDPITNRILGSITITYTNNSPTPLDQLWLQLDQNAFAPGSRNAALQGTYSSGDSTFVDGGFDISALSIAHQGEHWEPGYTIDDTRLRIPLNTPLPPHGSIIDISMDFAFVIPQANSKQPGWTDVAQGTIYQIAQWYPRISVFDDVNGWNTQPFLGEGDSHRGFGNYHIEITAPSDFLVLATGALLNPEEVFTREQNQRLDQARTSDTPVQIVKPKEIGRRKSRPNDANTLTWQFTARNVRDVAWAASRAFVLEASGWQNTLLMSAYPVEALGTQEYPGWEKSTEYLRHSVKYYSEHWMAYPYPVALHVAGAVQGKAYPMLGFNQIQQRDRALFRQANYIVGHSWFPMIVGSDERRHAWMDEGLTVFLNYYAHQDYYGSTGADQLWSTPHQIAEFMQSGEITQPIMTYPDVLDNSSSEFLIYHKPAEGLRLLREHILGPERFDAALKTYIKRWAFKHPQPSDFFRTIEQVTGEQLAWFWKGWFYGTDRHDPSIQLVSSPESIRYIALAQQTSTLLPIEIDIQFADGSAERRRIPIEAFFRTTPVLLAPFDDKSIERIIVDPDQRLPDADRSNNIWSR